MNDKMEHIALKYMNKMYGDLKKYRTDKYPNRIFFIKGKRVHMEYNLVSRELWVDNYSILDDLETMFSLEYDEFEYIITKWVEETYKLKGVTPPIARISPNGRWKRLIN
jgi:hypothetical protein